MAMAIATVLWWPGGDCARSPGRQLPPRCTALKTSREVGNLVVGVDAVGSLTLGGRGQWKGRKRWVAISRPETAVVATGEGQRPERVAPAGEISRRNRRPNAHPGCRRQQPEPSRLPGLTADRPARPRVFGRDFPAASEQSKIHACGPSSAARAAQPRPLSVTVGSMVTV